MRLFILIQTYFECELNAKMSYIFDTQMIYMY